jgi:intraflagellar transport protein 122
MSVFLPYAEWLVSTDCYEDAMQAYRKAGRKDLARKVLEELTSNAVSETRFKDAAYYYWMLSKESDGEDHALQSEYEHKADLYYAYSSIHTYITSPFTSYQEDMLFQVSRFIINSLGNADSIPGGISKASTLYTLAKQAMKVGAYKLARHAYDRLSKLQVPSKKQEEIELDALIVQARPVSDEKDYLPTCFRCFTVNPLLNPFTKYKGDVCTSCGHPFVRSFINFEILPLVEFVPEPSISDEEAIELIRQSSSKESNSTKKGGRHGGSESKVDNADVLTFGDDEGKSNFGSSKGGPGEQDLFARCMNHAIESQDNNYCPVTVNVKILMAMNRTEVFVCRPSSKQKRCTFYKNMLPDISIAISQSCHRFFHLEDFEFAYLSEQACPYSRLKNVGEYGSL